MCGSDEQNLENEDQWTQKPHNWRTFYNVLFTDHRLEHEHKFDWNNIKTLDEERILNKKFISEIIFIYKQNSLNLQTLNY